MYIGFLSSDTALTISLTVLMISNSDLLLLSSPTPYTRDCLSCAPFCPAMHTTVVSTLELSAYASSRRTRRFPEGVYLVTKCALGSLFRRVAIACHGMTSIFLFALDTNLVDIFFVWRSLLHIYCYLLAGFCVSASVNTTFQIKLSNLQKFLCSLLITIKPNAKDNSVPDQTSRINGTCLREVPETCHIAINVLMELLVTLVEMPTFKCFICFPTKYASNFCITVCRSTLDSLCPNSRALNILSTDLPAQ